MAMTIDRASVLPTIYAEVACGRSLDKVLSDEGMPSPSTFWRWHMDDAEIRDNLARARENGVERLMDECVDIADDSARDYVPSGDEDEDDRFNPEAVQRAKLRIDTRMKMAQMIAPRKYGAKLDMTTGGEKIGALADVIAAARARVADGNKA